MKRVVTAVTVILLTAGILVFLAGCGSDTGRAREYTLAGDAALEELQKESSGLARQINSILIEMQAGNVTTSTQLKEITDNFKSSSSKFFNKSSEAKKEYESVLKLKGVEAFKEYSRLMVDLTTYRESAVTAFMDMLGSAIQLAEKFESGQEIDMAEFQSLGETFALNFSSASEKAEELGKKAEELKNKNEL